MFTDKMKTVRMLGVMALVVAMFCSGAFLFIGGESDADTVTIDGTGYTTSDITIAPDYKWNYTVQGWRRTNSTVIRVRDAFYSAILSTLWCKMAARDPAITSQLCGPGRRKKEEGSV